MTHEQNAQEPEQVEVQDEKSEQAAAELDEKELKGIAGGLLLHVETGNS